jgi:hypothetical protein
MTAIALALVQEITEEGGLVQLEGGLLRLSAPKPLCDELLVRLRQHKAEIVALLSAAEPANDAAPETLVVPGATGLPQEIADGVHAILAAEGAPGVPPQRWPQVQRDAARLVEGGWVHQALALGWTAADLFGCDQRAPWYRLDRSGLLLLIGGHDIVELNAKEAALRTSTGSVLRFRRRPPASPPVILLWKLLIPAQATGPPIRGQTAHPDEERMAAEVLGGTPPPS